MTPTKMFEALSLLAEGQDLSQELAKGAMDELMNGESTPSQIGAFLMGLRAKGETIEEVTAFAQAMREHSISIQPTSDPLIDVCGTGGAKLKTFNISTTAAFIVAGAGISVAKHGNRSSTSLSGSADVLEALGVKLSVPPQSVKESIDNIGIGFLFAPGHHPAMKYAIGPRKELAIRTVFNMLGPLTNPAGANIHLMGVFSPHLVELYPPVLGNLGVKRAVVVHGVDGIDEFSTVGETLIGELKDGKVSQKRVSPENFGLKTTTIDKVKNISPEESAQLTRDILSGKVNDERLEIVLLNAGAALYAAGKATSIDRGIELSQESIQSGAATDKLQALINHTEKAAQ
jgi:anthranilate phosphoribosyltransferase